MIARIGTFAFTLTCGISSVLAAPAGGTAGINAAEGSAFRVRAMLRDDRQTLMYQLCQSEPCVAETSENKTLALPFAPTKASFERVNVGTEHPALHFTGEATGQKFELLFIEGALMFEGQTLHPSGQYTSLRFLAGDRAKVAVRSHHDARVTLCGEAEAPFATEAFNPKTQMWVRSTLPRLAKDRVKKATSLQATPTSKAGAVLLRATATSEGPGQGTALTDGNVSTAWTEQRTGDGRGEFVSLTGTGQVSGLTLRARPHASTNEVEPKTLWISTRTELFRAELPQETDVRVNFPQPIDAQCISLVLEDGQPQAAVGEPIVGLGEVESTSVFDTLLPSEMATRLEQESVDPALWAYVQHANMATLAALAPHVKSLGIRGKTRLLEAVSQHPHACSSPLLLALWGASDREIATRARARAERCAVSQPRSEPHTLLVRALDESRTRGDAAALLAMLSPREALKQLPQWSRDVQVRHALAKAIDRAASPEAVSAAFTTVQGTEHELPFLVAAGPHVTELPERVVADLEMMATQGSFETQYLTLGPLGNLAQHGSSRALDRVRAIMKTCSKGKMCYEPALRARAVDVARSTPALQDAIAKSVWDDNPRVRLMVTQSTLDSVVLLLLTGDTWSFVREGAVDALGQARATEAIDKRLSEVLHADPSASVRLKAATALGLHHAGGWRLLETLETKEEDPAVRAEAAEALGALCYAEAADELSSLARGKGEPPRPLQLAAVKALGRLHPRDLAERLAPLQKSVDLGLRDAATKARATRACTP